MLRDSLSQTLSSIAPNVQVEELSNEQVRALYVQLNATDGASDRSEAIESIVNDSQYRMDPETMDVEAVGGSNSIREAVSQLLQAEAVDADVSTLTNAQVSALYIELTSGDDTDASKIEAILN